MTNCRDFMETDCIRLKRGVCRLDLKPCRENCPLRKTREEMERHKDENMANGITFTVTCSEDDRKKLFELMASDGVETLYIEKINGGLFPVANIERHPDCPKHIYEAWKRSLLQWNR